MKDDLTKDLDRTIREALRQDDSRLLASLSEEQSMHEMMLDTFRGRRRWLTYLIGFWMLLFFALAIVFGYMHFAVAESTRDLAISQTLFFLFTIGLMGLKVWWWMELQRNSLAREVKRVELELSLLAKRHREMLDKKGSEEDPAS